MPGLLYNNKIVFLAMQRDMKWGYVRRLYVVLWELKLYHSFMNEMMWYLLWRKTTFCGNCYDGRRLMQQTFHQSSLFPHHAYLISLMSRIVENPMIQSHFWSVHHEKLLWNLPLHNIAQCITLTMYNIINVCNKTVGCQKRRNQGWFDEIDHKIDHLIRRKKLIKHGWTTILFLELIKCANVKALVRKRICQLIDEWWA